MHDFARDDAWQRGLRDRVIKPGFYDVMVPTGHYVFLDRGKVCHNFQLAGVDTLVMGKDGVTKMVEEKTVRWPGYEYDCYCIETHGDTREGKERPGWVYTIRAELLLYSFEREDGGAECHLMEVPQLKAWFAEHEERLRPFGPLKTYNASMGKLAPIEDVRKEVQVWIVDCPPGQQGE